MSDACPHCQSQNLKWVTLRTHVPVDVLQCQDCGKPVREEDWTAPLMAMRPGRCVNCGDRREQDVCIGCGLSHREDDQVHDELRQMVAPTHNLLNAAREASRQGRRLLALKLATAAAYKNEEDQGDVARALRIWLLSAIGEANSALEEATSWVENTPEPTSLAYASHGQQLQHHGYPGAAADAYARALQKDPNQWPLRARRAQLLVGMQREGQALSEVVAIFQNRADERSIAMAIEVAETLCDMFEKRARDDEIQHLLSQVGGYVERSALLLAHTARVEALNGDPAKARQFLKQARRLNPDLEIYQRVQRAIKPTRSSWWRW